MCDVDADIDLFVRDKATGSEHPHSVPYINFYHPTDNLGGSGECSSVTGAFRWKLYGQVAAYMLSIA